MEYDLRGWVDLGLPSGKLWCFDNEEGYFTFDEAVEKFQDQLPTIEDWKELIDNTTQRFDKRRKGLVLKAPNGNKLFLPHSGNIGYKNNLSDVNRFGYYWAFHCNVRGRVDSLWAFLSSGGIELYYNQDGWWSNERYSVRLTKAK